MAGKIQTSPLITDTEGKRVEAGILGLMCAKKNKGSSYYKSQHVENTLLWMVCDCGKYLERRAYVYCLCLFTNFPCIETENGPRSKLRGGVCQKKL